MSYKRGEIFYIERAGDSYGSEQQAGRPAMIVSNDINNEFSITLEVVYLTTQPKKVLPTHIDIGGTKKNSIALCEQVHTVSVHRVGDFVLTELGDVETGKQCQPRQPKEKSNTEQISLFAEKE